MQAGSLYCCIEHCSIYIYRSVPGKHPCNCLGCSNGKRPLLGKHPGNMSQGHNDDEADNTYEDDSDIDDLDPFSDSEE